MHCESVLILGLYGDSFAVTPFWGGLSKRDDDSVNITVFEYYISVPPSHGLRQSQLIQPGCAAVPGWVGVGVWEWRRWGGGGGGEGG